VTGYPRSSRRDRGISALIEGFFGSAWFGWGHAAATAIWLDIGTALALVVAIAGAVIGFRSPASTAVLRDRAAARRYGILVGIEFGLAGLGAGILGAIGQTDFIPVWVCAVVGIHFVPLASVLRDRLYVPLGVLLCGVAVAALVTALTTGVAASTVTGLGAGYVLVVFGVIALALAVTTPPAGQAPGSASG
jgi:hypothetical protein